MIKRGLKRLSSRCEGSKSLWLEVGHVYPTQVKLRGKQEGRGGEGVKWLIGRE